jgi:hypothetical protein
MSKILVLPRRRAHEDVGSLCERTLALRADRRRQPLDPAGRIRAAEPTAHRLAGLMHCAVLRLSREGGT